MSFLEVRSVTVSGPERQILADINFTLEKGTHLVIAGETGSGKSTLLKVIAGLAQPDAGSVWFESLRVAGSLEKLVPGHPEIAYLSQQFELPKFLRVEQVLAYANTFEEQSAHDLYELCQISHLLKRKTDQLSGGERQRIALARLLSKAPKLFLLDEPFSNLDMTHKTELKIVLDEIASTLDLNLILVSHDPVDTLPWAEQIIVLHQGNVVQHDLPQKVYNYPVNDYVAGLFGRFIELPESIRLKLGVDKYDPERVYFRCEDFLVVPNGGQLTGTVAKCAYFGAYYIIDVNVEGTIIPVKSRFRMSENAEIEIKLEVLD